MPRLRIELDKFTRFGNTFYTGLLVVVNSDGAEMVFPMGEYKATETIAAVFNDASRVRVVNEPFIAAHLAKGKSNEIL